MRHRERIKKGEFVERLEAFTPGGVVLNCLEYPYNQFGGHEPYRRKSFIELMLKNISNNTEMEVYTFYSSNGNAVLVLDYWVPDYGAHGHGC